MLHHGKAMAAALAVALTLALAASASAEILEFFPNPEIPAGRTTLVFTGGLTTVRCPVTISGALVESQITVATGATIARDSRMALGTCEGGGTVTVLALPWTVTYVGVEGTLPEGVRKLNLQIHEFSVNFSSFGGAANCLYAGNVEEHVPVLRGTDPYEAEKFTLSSSLSKRAGGELCPASVTLSSEGIWDALWNFFFGESLPMRSTPAWTTPARVGLGLNVHITALQNVTVAASGLERGNVGWIATWPPGGCNRAYVPGEPNQTCTVTVTVNNPTANDRILLRDAGGNVVGKTVLHL
jgi:hypothetical protein